MKKPEHPQPNLIQPLNLVKDPAEKGIRIGKFFEDRHQFEEAVQQLLKDHEANKPTGIFY